MDINLREIYNKAIKYWNRNELEKTAKFMDYIFLHYKDLDVYDKANIANFYVRINYLSRAKAIFLYMIYNNEINEISLEKFLNLFDNKNSHINEKILDFINNLQLFANNIKIKYLLLKLYKNRGSTIKSYDIAVFIVDFVEQKRYVNNFYIEYYNTLIYLTEMEYELSNMYQARFHIKKIIYNPPYNTSLEKVLIDTVYWSVLLEICNCLEGEFWLNIKANYVSDEIKYLLYLFDKKEKSVLKNIKFSDSRLIHIYDVLDTYIKYSLKDDSWKENINKISPKKSYMAYILHYQYICLEIKNINTIISFISKYYKYHFDIPQISNLSCSLRNKNNNDILEKYGVTIQFIGASNYIGGSSILIKYKEDVILLDAGINIKDNCYPNFFKLSDINLDIQDINHLIISHAHLDHIGSIPYLYCLNKNINIYSTKDTKDIMKVILEDSLKIMNDKKTENLYTIDDIKNISSSINICNFNKEYRISDDIKIILFRAGHILGASSILLNINGLNILYTGDFCCENQYFVEGLNLPKDLNIDVLITESTYANYQSNFNLSRNLQELSLVKTIEKCIFDNNGTVLIPSFAVGRTQEVLSIIKNYYKNDNIPFDVYVDGRAKDVCDIYQRNTNKTIIDKGISYANIKQIKKDKDILQKRFNNSCIVASSGMLNDDSSSAIYAKYLIDDSKNLILFSGYLDEESNAGEIKKLNENILYPKILINNELKLINCNIKSYKLSAHAKKSDILNLISFYRPRYVFLVHGDTHKEYEYLGSKDLAKYICPSIEELLKYIEDIKIFRPYDGQIFKF